MKRIISVLLSVLLAIGAFVSVTATVHAEESNSYKEDFINALLENEDEWYENWGTPIVYPSAMTFTDLNFDGKLEFIMQYGGGWMANCEADAYYFENGIIHIAKSNNLTANNKGLENNLIGYYDTINKKYILLGESRYRISMTSGWKGNFLLSFVGSKIDTDYYSSSMWNNNEIQYYCGANGYANSTGIKSISEAEYNEINKDKLENLIDINMKREFIYCSDWENYSYAQKKQALEKSYDGFKYDDYTSGIKIYSDHTNLNVKKGDSINIGAGIFSNNQQITNISKLTFSVDDTSMLSVSSTSVHENCRFITLKAKKTGTTYVNFSDSNTGYVTRVPITVYDNNCMAFTVSGVPTQNIEKYTTNFYNVNGLYVDSYEYSTNTNKTTTVSFDVYNTNYIYGAVEVYNSDGKMTDAVVIDKMTNNAGSIKSAVWDNTCCLVRDVIDGDLLSYRQESGYSKKTSVKVTIPENGYIKITNDTSSSFLTALLNGVDILMSLKSVAGDISGFDVKSKSFADKITKKLVKEAAYAQFIKDEDKFAKNLVKGVSKKSTIFNSESLGNFSETFVNNLNSLKIEKLIFDTAVDFGWGIGESVLEYFMGPIGAALKGMFSFGDISNLIIEYNHYVKSGSCGSISIQNQGGGVRSASQITVTSDTNFNSDTALKVFEIQADSELLDIIKKVNPELYEKIQTDLSITYNISMIKDGKEVQPGGEVEVSIPIPESLIAYAYTGKLKIYRVEEDGSVTEMNVKVKNGCLVFITNHFSIYTMTAENISETDYTPGDINNDGKINMKDIVLLQQYLNGWNVSINKQAANVNADSSINMKDIVLLQQYLNGWKVVLK